MMGEYKGMEKVPEGWRRVRLGEVSKPLKNGYVYDYTQLVDEGFPITRIESISEGYLNTKKIGYLNIKFEKVKDFVMEKGDILFSHINSIEHVGKTAIYDGNLNILINGMNLLLIRTVKTLCIPDFLIYVLKKEKTRERIRNLARRAVNQVSINIKDLQTFFLFLPPLPEQIKISEILETVDNAIEKTERIIEKYRRIKQGLMHDLLTRGIDENSNIRNEKTHKFKDSPIGRIPEEWEVVKLGEVINLNPDKLYFEKGKIINYIDIESVKEGKIQKIEVFKIDDAPSRAQRVVKMKDVIVSTVRPNLKAFTIIPPQYDGYICSTGFAVIRAKSRIDSLFLFFAIWHDNSFLKQVLPLVVGSNYPAVNSVELLNILIPLPPLSEQQRIASILSQIDETIEKETAYKEKLQRLKSGLMEDLLTGRVRVNNLVKEAYDEKD